MNLHELRSYVQKYLALRNLLGFQLRWQTRPLEDFVNWLEAHDFSGLITAQQAVDWACLGSSHPGAHARRLSAIRGFLTYLQASVPKTEVPERGLFETPGRPKPYILSDPDILNLLEMARQLGPEGSLRPYTFTTLIGLLLSCGLRIGEAIRLRLGDVELSTSPPRLQVLQTKFGKSRVVPVHPTTAHALRDYVRHRASLGYDGFCDTFFVSERLGPLKIQTVEATFLSLVRHAGLRGPAGEPGPTLQDLRHNFAVKRLNLWYREGADVRGRLPELSVFLGHTRTEHTYWYLSATPELLTCAAKRFEVFSTSGGAL